MLHDLPRRIIATCLMTLCVAQVQSPANDDADRYAIPGDSIEALEQFIDRIHGFRPGDTNEMLEHERHAPDALRKAAHRIIALKPTPDSTAYKKAVAILLEEAIESIDGAAPKKVVELSDQLYDLLRERKRTQPLNGRDMRMALDVIDQLEETDQNRAIFAYRRFGELFDGSQDLEMATMARMMQGAARRLELPGRRMQLTGIRMDGTAFDLASLRGKVVLVDFWATWCRPCVAEHPRFAEAYRKYHDQGFEVVGVSLDVDRRQLEEYLERCAIPWITLHPNERGQQNPVLQRYGIMAIPVVILINSQGQVVSIDARGENLEELIESALAETAQGKGG